MKRLSTFVAAFTFAIVFMGAQFASSCAFADGIKLVPLHGQLIAANEPGLANGGFDSDIQQLNSESDQSQLQITDHSMNSAHEDAATRGQSDGLSVKLIRLSKSR